MYPSAFVNNTDAFTDDIHLSAFHSSCDNHRWIYRQIYYIGISHTHQQRYWRRIPSVFHTITDGINPSVYFKREIFFWRAISVYKTIDKLPTNSESHTDGIFPSLNYEILSWLFEKFHIWCYRAILKIIFYLILQRLKNVSKSFNDLNFNVKNIFIQSKISLLVYAFIFLFDKAMKFLFSNKLYRTCAASRRSSTTQGKKL
jgi:hypothetical protein